MFSTRTRNSECVNLEGKKSVHLADGANYLYLEGDEYFDIFPVIFEKIQRMFRMG